MLPIATAYLDSHVGFSVWLATLYFIGPGLLVWAMAGNSNIFRQLGFSLFFLVACAFSLILNFQAFFIFVVILGVQVSTVLPFVSIFAVALGWWLLRNLPIAQDAVLAQSAEGKSSGYKLELPFFGGVIALVATSVIFIRTVAADTPGVFFEWDAVASWNRWAVEWFVNTPPINTAGYPQLLPTMIAAIYTWLGSAQTEPVARFFLLIFPVGTCLIFVDAFQRWKNPAFLFGAAIWLFILTKVLPGMPNSGYADIPVAFFVTITGYVILLGTSGEIPAKVAMYLGAICAAGALLTKQPGGIALIFGVAAACRFGVLSKLTGVVKQRACIFSAALFLILAGPWYLYFFWMAHLGHDASNLVYLTTRIHGNRSFLDRLMHAITGPIFDVLSTLGPPHYVGGVCGVLMLLACSRRLGRILLFGFVLPYGVLWALLFSYDIRNLVLALPALSLVFGIGLSYGVERIEDLFIFFGFHKAPRYITILTMPRASAQKLVLICGLAISVVSFIFPFQKKVIESVHHNGQMQSGDPVLNRRLLDFAISPGFDGKVLTSYAPMLMIDKLKDHAPSFSDPPPRNSALMNFALRDESPWCYIQSLVPNSTNVRYLLYPKNLIKNIIDKGIQDGSLELLFEINDYHLLRTHCVTPEKLTETDSFSLTY